MIAVSLEMSDEPEKLRINYVRKGKGATILS